MAWQPVRQKQTGLSPRMRNVVSRVTMGVVGVVLIYAAYKCVWASGMLDRAYEQANATGYQRGRVAALPLMVGVGLALLGAGALGVRGRADELPRTL